MRGRVLISLLALATAAGCANSGDAKKILASNEGLKLASTGLNGTWVLSPTCSKSSEQRLLFSGNLVTSTTTFFKQQNCADASVTIETQAEAALDGPLPNQPGASKANLTVKNVKVTPLTQDAADELNESSACGVKDWKANTARDVSSQNCGDDTDTAGTVIYTIVKIENNQLYFGAEDSKAEAARPTTFSTDSFFIRQ